MHYGVISAYGEDGIALTGKTAKSNVLVINTACQKASLSVTKPADLTLYYTLAGDAMYRNFALWKDTNCPTSWWVSTMTAKSDSLTSHLVYNSINRKVTIKKIANDVSGSKSPASTRESSPS